MFATLMLGGLMMSDTILRPLCPLRADAMSEQTGEPLGLAVGAILPADRLALLRRQDVMKIRVLEHAGMATMDVAPGRLNVRVDEAGRIVRLSCG